MSFSSAMDDNGYKRITEEEKRDSNDPACCTSVQLEDPKHLAQIVPFEDLLPTQEDADQHTLRKNSTERIIVPSEEAYAKEILEPCDLCGRTFAPKTLERHVKVCDKVNNKKRQVFDATKARTKNLDVVMFPTKGTNQRRKSSKLENEMQTCPHCSRKFGPKPYDRHVAWCEEKSKRLQDSPKRDMLALAKLHARTFYNPRTASLHRKESGGSPPRRTSQASMTASCHTPVMFNLRPDDEVMSRSMSRCDSTKSERRPSLKRTKSVGKSSDVSSLHRTEHTKDTEETKFIRASTGRGSIRQGPVPTRASVLRIQAKADIRKDGETRKCPTPLVLRRSLPSPMQHRKRTELAAPATHLSHHDQPLLRPSVVRPSQSSSSFGFRREPEGIEHGTSGKEIISGSYDHSQEYDPFQSAAKQMQELLFGSSLVQQPPSGQQAPLASSLQSFSQRVEHDGDTDLQPSTNSAFRKYVPSTSNVPSTADINNRFGVKNRIEPHLTLPRKAMANLWEGMPSQNRGMSSGATVARFCHECGNPFALPNIRFCCECGVKRLYV